MEIEKNGISYSIDKNIEKISAVMLLSEGYYKSYPYLRAKQF